MAIQKNTEKTYEFCPFCGRRSRRSDCLVCSKCKNEHLEPLEEKNAEALLEERFEDIVDPFELVLQRGQETLKQKQVCLQEAEAERETRRSKLWQQAEHEVAAIISSNGKGGNRMDYIQTKALRYQSTKIRFKELKFKDEIFRRAHGLAKGIEILKKHLAGIQEKRKEYQEKKATEVQVEQIVV